MYQFKPRAEFMWAIINGALVAVAQLLVDFQPEIITDWRMWAITGVGAIARAVGVSLLAVIGKAKIAA